MTRETAELIKNTNEFIVLDLETTGLSYKKGARITDVCAYRIKDNNYIEKFNTLVNPGMSIPEDIVKITGITDSMVQWAPSIREVLSNLKTFIGDKVVVGHNIKFDWDRFLVPAFKDKLLTDMNNKTICTLQLSKELMKDSKSHKLGDVYERLTGKDARVQHRAEPDVIMTCEVLCILKRFIEQNYDGIIEYCK